MSIVPVILSYNHEALTRRCVDSVLKNGFIGPIYLVHNGSQEQIIENLKRDYPGIDHLVIKANCGFSGGANRGLMKVYADGCETVLFLTNDTVIDSIDFLGIEKNWLQRNEPILIAPKIFKRQTQNIDSLGGSIDFRKGRLNHLNHPQFTNSKNHRFYVPGTAFLINKKAWLKTGQFDESLGTYWEDVDYSLRAQKRGVTLGISEDLTLRHGVGKTCHGNPLYTVFHYHRNRKIVSWRHGNRSARAIFAATYGFDIARKVFKYAISRDQIRLKLILRALVS